MISLGAPGWVWPAAAVLVAAVILVGVSYRRPSALGGLKLLGFLTLAICLVEPLWTRTVARPGSNIAAVVADSSRSMTLRDRDATTSRGDNLRMLLEEEWLARLGAGFRVHGYAFDRRLRPLPDFPAIAFDGEASAIGTALETIRSRYRGRPLAGVLLFTDGNSTDAPGDLSGLPPIYPVVMGREAPARDLAVGSVSVAQTLFEDAPVTIRAEVSALGCAGDTVAVRLLDETGAEAHRQERRVEGDPARLPFVFRVKPEATGVLFYRLEVSGAAGPEATDANNARTAVVDRGRGPYRILYVSGRPNWDYKFLRRALEEDRQVELAALIRMAAREPKFEFIGRSGESGNPLFRGFGKKDPDEIERFDKPVLIRQNTRDEAELKDGFPTRPEDLFKFHGVILDDLEAAFFTQEQMTLLERFVSERGGGLMMLGGAESFRQGRYDRTPVGQMLPIYLDKAEPVMTRTGRWSITREGMLEPFARLRETEAEESARLAEMPPFKVLNRAGAAKPGASVMAEVDRVPALIAHRYGDGRVAALAVGDLWRWGFGDTARGEDLAQGWRQLVRWLIAGTPGRVALETAGDGRSVRLSVRVRDSKFEPLDGASVELEVTGPAGATKLRAEPSTKKPGIFEATFLPPSSGAYRAAAKVTGPESGAAEAGWAVDLGAEEFRALAPDRALLERIASTTGGRVVEASELSSWVSELAERRVPIVETRAEPLWHRSAVLALGLLCLVAEWGLRRRRGLA